MAYNKAKAEQEWLRWKEAEEKKLRELGVDEDTIQRLHTYDWAQFKSERRFLERWEEWSPYVDWIAAKDVELPSEPQTICWRTLRTPSFFKCSNPRTSIPSKSSC